METGNIRLHLKTAIAALDIALLGETGDTAGRPAHITENLRAYGAYVGGRMLWNSRTSEGVYQSIDLVQQATMEDPEICSGVFVTLADAYAFDMKLWHKSEATAQQALALDPRLGEAHVYRGWCRCCGTATTRARRRSSESPSY